MSPTFETIINLHHQTHCPACNETFKPRQHIIKMTCGHLFHANCWRNQECTQCPKPLTERTVSKSDWSVKLWHLTIVIVGWFLMHIGYTH